ncbi:MAG: glycoside hydrolase family 2 TIM barrel-domain containing protein [Victivallales bacterium]|nr:glycoside hydrolase family 2 TIM barrel-domain containing protein [Victivallales bacterium]
MDECDRQGIMVIFEMALHGSFGCYAYGCEEFRRTVIAEMRELFLEYRRHPSIALWSLGNEMIVNCERDRNLGASLFNVLDGWITELRRLDSRPIIANSGSDAANLVPKSIGDVDDVHQYGGWYVETLRDLRNFGCFTRKNDMLFQPCISTESIAAYTNDNGEFFIKSTDIRQKKMVLMRLGEITDFSKQAQKYQAFMLKEYAEELWRLRHRDSNFAGYIPFGQYTWFSHPFDKSTDGIQPKLIWDTYRKVMGPVHIQFECWDRNICDGGKLSGDLHLLHEDISLPASVEFRVEISWRGKVTHEQRFAVDYHCRADVPISIGPFCGQGEHTLEIKVYCADNPVAHNDLEFRVYPGVRAVAGEENLVLYDPTGKLNCALQTVNHNGGEILSRIGDVLSRTPETTRLVIGPHALDRDTDFFADSLKAWVGNGGRIIVLEQNPGAYTENIFNLGVGFVKKYQPYWSRWATNLVKHSDRADMLQPEHPVFAGLVEDDLRWWNGDTFLTHSYLNVITADNNDCILSRIGNGLAPDELMPVEYDYVEPGYSIIMMERTYGKGAVLLSSLLIGEKASSDPVAAKLLVNLLDMQ